MDVKMFVMTPLGKPLAQGHFSSGRYELTPHPMSLACLIPAFFKPQVSKF